MNKNITAVSGGLLLFLLLAGCTKEPAEPPSIAEQEPTPAQLYLQMRTGNSWVYETYQRNIATEKSVLLSKTDSLAVASDTTINRRRYLRLSGSRLGNSVERLLRLAGTDALGKDGQLYFTTERRRSPFPLSEATLPDGAVSAEAKVEAGGRVEVPFGVFETLVLQQDLQLLPEYGGDGSVATDRIDRAYYAPGIGMVQYTRYYPEQNLEVGMRLLRCDLH